MNDLPIGLLIGILILLLMLSAFFSGSETALMSLNRYRLRHLAKKHKSARITAKLLDQPDRLIGLILLGNNFVNILATAIATVVATRLYGEAGIAIATAVLTFVVLVFAEVTPKTLATLRAEPIAFFAARIYTPMMKVLLPLVKLINTLPNILLASLLKNQPTQTSEALSSDELRTIVHHAGNRIPKEHLDMLLNILDLERAVVDEVMIPRNDIEGIDLNDDWDSITQIINHSEHSRLVVYRDNIDDVVGVISLRKRVEKPGLTIRDKAELEGLVKEPLYVPENTSLTQQLLNFKEARKRMGLVIDEYGDILGLITMADILEEIVGDFTSNQRELMTDVRRDIDGAYLVDGSTPIRSLHRKMGWEIESEGAKTVNGLFLEHSQNLPRPGDKLTIADREITVLEVEEQAIQLVKIASTQPLHADEQRVNLKVEDH